MTLILAMCATYRIARLLAYEEGPAEVATWLRNRWTRDDWIGRGLRCPLCLGFWIALPAALACGVEPWWLTWLGIAGAQAALHAWTGDSDAR